MLSWGNIVYFLVALIVSIMMGYIIVPRLRQMMVGQSIREEGPKSHYSKAGTPTIGGLIFISSILICMAVFRMFSPAAIISSLSLLLFGGLGFIDDYIKVVKKRNLGLTARQKLAGQLLVSIIIVIVYVLFKGTNFPLIIPFTGRKVINMGPVIGTIFTVFVLVGATNSVNLTDGLDGLAAGVMNFYILSFFAVANSLSSEFSGWLLMAAASLLGFLHFNSHPAKVFMGDTGSLGLGGMAAGIALAMDMTLFIPIAGLVFVIETLSVMIQVAVFKKTGKRVFLMSPLHHHYEQKGWKETAVVKLFYSVAIACAIISFLAY
ncbi:MAG: phospho-N-acetylmuramoyl-pentapeptide-transferase [Tissierellia bacterium]|nr:phospho-N-acetylmuramoyl-pentapeptide-transferase [Tissierellia bacterium]